VKKKTLCLITLAAVTAAACSREPTEAREAVACAAPLRTEPSLDSGVLPTATYEIVQQDVGETEGEDGKTVTRYIQHIVEKATLPGGADVEISLGGCEYYANVYVFSLPRTGQPASETAFWLNKTAELIGHIETASKDPRINLPALRRELQRRASDPAAAPFAEQAVLGVVPVTVAGSKVQHHYQVQVDERADRAKVTVQYAVGPL
jgi:hypothetical protein